MDNRVWFSLWCERWSFLKSSGREPTFWSKDRNFVKHWLWGNVNQSAKKGFCRSSSQMLQGGGTIEKGQIIRHETCTHQGGRLDWEVFRHSLGESKASCHDTRIESGTVSYWRPRCSTSTIPTAFEWGRREEFNKSTSGSCEDIRILCKVGRLREALHILSHRGIPADYKTYVCVLQECINTKGLSEGKEVHAHIVQTGCKLNMRLCNLLLNMYVKCRSMVAARQVFDNMPEQDVFSWTIMIAGYAKHGCSSMEGFKLYEQMQRKGVTPNRVTFICVLSVCASLGALEKGKEVHDEIDKAGIESDIILENTIVDMYAKCGSMKDARQVLDNMVKRDVVSWSAIIAGYAQQGCGLEALKNYEQMQREGVTPNMVTFICVLNACSSLGDLEKGQQVHADAIKAGIISDVIVETALVDMYAKCGSMKDACQVFDNMTKRDVFSWNTMIAGYAGHECGSKAFEFYEQMQQQGVACDRVTFICILNACAGLGALEKGKEVHADIMKAGTAPYINLENALINMYSKCGSIEDARQVFDKMTERDVVSWTAMITGYAQHGCGREVLQLLKKMQKEGLKPDKITFTSLLSACSHVGLVDEGYHYFNSMSEDHGLTPAVEHFSCMVDLLGRAGRLNEAEDFIDKMPIKAHAGVWRALLGGCRIHAEVKVAERAAKKVLQSNP